MKQKFLFAIPIICLMMFFGTCKQTKTSKITFKNGKNLEETYTEYCSGCHGNQLQHFKILKSAEKKSVAELAKIIKEGNVQKGMSSFSALLGDDEILKISEYIKEYDYKENQIVEIKEAKNYTTEVVIDGLEIPWGMEFLPNGDLLVAEKKGTLSRFSKAGGLTPIKGLPPIRTSGQGGLLDLKLHPNYKENGWLYISYSYIDEKDKSTSNTAIIRAKLKNDVLTDIQNIYKGTPAVKTDYHFGNRMVFDKEGFLYFSNGDRGMHFEFAQKVDNANGKIHRLKDDGTIPSDNPFAGQANSIASIYSYGHRNPQGMALHPLTGAIWEHEHGPKGGDEINIIKKGANYGWPVISYGINYNGTILTELTENEGMEQPIHYYLPSIAPCGMAFINGDVYPDWKNNLLIGSLKFQYLERLVFKDNQVIYQEKLLEEFGSRVRDVRVSPEGFIYVALEGPGRIIKLLPKK